MVEDKDLDEKSENYMDSTSNTLIGMKSRKEEYDKKTKYILNKRGEIIKKLETSTKPGLVHFGTGSKGEIKVKNVDIRNTGIIELKNLIQKVAYLQTLMSKAKEKYEDMDLEELETQWEEQIEEE